MRTRVIVPNAERHIEAISDFIRTGNPERADDYVRVAFSTFRALNENRLPARASENLPRDVRRIFVPDFKGYTLRLLYRGDYIALVAAFRPGLTRAMQDEETWPGLSEFHRDHE